MYRKRKDREPLTKAEKQMLKYKKMLSSICKECGREHHIPVSVCQECWRMLNNEIK